MPPGEVAAALRAVGLPMLGLNTARGGPGEFGLSALPGREAEARDAIDAAIQYAAAVGAAHVHVMAGMAEGAAAEAAFRANLAHACDRAAPLELDVVIEPLNPRDVPGYFLCTTGKAARIAEASGRANLKLLFDGYHVALTEGDVIGRLAAMRPILGHVQISGVPERGQPVRGRLDWTALLAALDDSGWDKPVGAEYRTGGPTETTLGWLRRWRSAD